MNPTPRTTANTIFKLARASGLPPNRALELVAAGQAESSLDPNATNKSSGAAGVFQLLSSGYRQRAQQLGGVYNPTANTNAILPDYVNYWKQHPTALPGEAGRDVERSGEGAGFYAKPLPLVRGLVSGAGAVPPAGPLAPTSAASAPARVGGGTWVDALRAKPAGGWVDALRTAPAAPVAAAAAPAAPAGSWVTKLSAAQAPASQPGPLPLPQPRTVTSPPHAGTYKFVAPEPGVDLKDVNPQLLDAVNRLAQYLGKPVTITSGYRDTQKQAGLYQRYVNSGFDRRYIAAKPGRSNHERGQAVDLVVGGTPIARAVSASILRRFGLHNPVPGDLPHTTLLTVRG